MSKQSPRVLVAAIISEPDPPRVLLTKHEGHGRWHFPDGEVGSRERLAAAMHRSFQRDLGVGPAKIDERACLPTDTINFSKDLHLVTLHLIVSLPSGAQFMPRSGIEFAWFPLDSHKDPSFVRKALASTYDIFCRLDADK